MKFADSRSNLALIVPLNLLLGASFGVLILNSGCATSNAKPLRSEAKVLSPATSSPAHALETCDGRSQGAVEAGYLQPLASGGSPCIHAVRTCVEGIWSGLPVYPSCDVVH